MHTLTAKQLEAIEVLSTGLSAPAAADALGIHRTTLQHWCRTIPDFRNALEASKRAFIETFRGAMNALAAPSVRILRETLENPSTSPALRVRTALAIIKFVTTPAKSPSTKQQVTNELLDAAYLEGYRVAEIHHNSSLSTQEQTAEAETSTPNQTPRNALCPCGSKLKFKRCCGKDAPPVLSHPASIHHNSSLSSVSKPVA